MLKNIEKYLLTNYPVIWNLKIIHTGLFILAAHLLFFFIGYIITLPVAKNNFYDLDGIYFFLTGCAILTAVLIFIFWLIQYNKYNGLKSFYPISNSTLYIEWLLIFVVCISTIFIPYSLTFGKNLKWETTVSEKEYQEAKKIICRTLPLLPSNEHDFQLRGNTTPLKVGDANIDRTKFDTGLYTYEEGATTPENPIEYIGSSLLYYESYYDYNYFDDSDAETAKVHQWLVDQKEDSIKATIEAFLDLQKKHDLKSNINADTWMEMIYNPPLYPVNKYNLIQKHADDPSYWGGRKYTEMGKLRDFYRQLNYDNKAEKDYNWAYIIMALAAMGISVMTFSARITSGRSWIFALLSLGILFFIFLLFSGFLALTAILSSIGLVFLPLFWLGIFIAIGWRIGVKLDLRERKGRSSIYFNIFLWCVPALLFWLYQIYMFLAEGLDLDYNFQSLSYWISIITIGYTIVIMYPVCILAKKWKALPED